LQCKFQGSTRKRSPTLYTLATKIREAAEVYGYEEVFNALITEDTPWCMIQCLNRIEKWKRGYNHSFDRVYAEMARKQEFKKGIKEKMEVIGAVIGVAKDVIPAA